MSRVLEPVAIASDESVLDVLPRLRAALSGAGPALLPYAADAGPPAALRPGEPLDGDEDDAADPTVAVVTTSGSTGTAKGVLLHASALLASVSATHDRLGGAGRWLLALPAQHVAGLQVLLRALVGGAPPVVLDLTRGFRPDDFAEAAARMRGPRRYTSLVPTQLGRLLDAGGPGLAALTGFDAVLVGGAATAPSLQERASTAGVRLVTTYGMSETCGGCVYDGVPLDGVRVRLAPDGSAGGAGSGEGADGPDGRVLLGGPVLARGYRGRSADDGSAAGGFFVADGARWFATDDAGRLPDDGRLDLLGRLDDVVTTGGLKVAPSAVEAALLRLPGVTEAVVVGVPDAEWGQRVVAALVLADGATAPSMAQVRERVSADVAARATPRQLLVLDRMPLRGPGKPDRTALARLATLGDHG
ncbi:o-succinylbenzoate--CoA ligase [Kineosporia sp. A_224]|uniref:o-succinylbenzoate--CoA ligase n=1 Tax=Kineosporia sp. A_224 TaxID=1962180 RepID=UPI000B4BDAC0|nr:o-succinylbenzoate--CoA ligase [Kineosporia sp. A_224]